MLKKVITYDDYDGLTRTEEFCFHINETEMSKLELTTPGGYRNYLQKIVDAKDISELYRTFEKLILLAYGEKSADGRRFMKSEQMSIEFTQTEAYNQLIQELLSDSDKMNAFVNGLMPAKLVAVAQAKAGNVIDMPKA